jgi:DNA sulfur modification protein DndB
VMIKQHDQVFYLVNLPASIVTKISYASIRGRDNEQGAVQRVLNTRRISGIKEFVLKGGSFPNSIVINWVKQNYMIDNRTNTLSFEVEEASAQLIDGQHRVAGIREAIQERAGFASYE